MADNILIKDGNASNIQVKTTETSGIHVPHHNIDNLEDILVSLTSILTELQQKTEPNNTQTIEGTVSISGTPTVNIGAIAAIPSSLIAANNFLTNAPLAIKESPGVVVGWNIINLNPITVYVKFYNSTVSNTIVGLSSPAFILAIPGGSSDNPGIFYQNSVFVPQRLFSEAITVACVTELGTASTTAPVTPIYIEVSYQ